MAFQYWLRPVLHQCGAPICFAVSVLGERCVHDLVVDGSFGVLLRSQEGEAAADTEAPPPAAHAEAHKEGAGPARAACPHKTNVAACGPAHGTPGPRAAVAAPAVGGTHPQPHPDADACADARPCTTAPSRPAAAGAASSHRAEPPAPPATAALAAAAATACWCAALRTAGPTFLPGSRPLAAVCKRRGLTAFLPRDTADLLHELHCRTQGGSLPGAGA